MDEEEIRIDPQDGMAYTQKDFVEQYGGTIEWNAAVPASGNGMKAARLSEFLRIDPNDGFAYSREGFIVEYGGTGEWDAAKPAAIMTRETSRANSEACAARSTGLFDELQQCVSELQAVPASRMEYRLDPNSGLACSKQDFVRKYEGSDEWDSAPPIPKLLTQTGSSLFGELIAKLPMKRMPLDEEYRVDPSDGDCYTRDEFITKYGTDLGGEKWEAAKIGLERLVVVEELDPREGDLVLTVNSLEGFVLKRIAMRIRLEVVVEGETQRTWKEFKDISKILAKYEKKCFHFRIDVLAPDWGRCKCGRKKAQHHSTAIRRKSGLYREVGTVESLSPNAPIPPELEGTTAGPFSAAASSNNQDHEEKGSDSFQENAPMEAVFGEEFRIDPNDGFAYSLHDFVSEYGGTIEWNAAAHAVDTTKKTSRATAAASVEEGEFRIDHNDGNAYQRSSFLTEYGSIDEWDAAKPAMKTTRRMSKISWK